VACPLPVVGFLYKIMFIKYLNQFKIGFIEAMADKYLLDIIRKIESMSCTKNKDKDIKEIEKDLQESNILFEIISETEDKYLEIKNTLDDADKEKVRFVKTWRDFVVLNYKLINTNHYTVYEKGKKIILEKFKKMLMQFSTHTK
jgi:hypothetical protein